MPKNQAPPQEKVVIGRIEFTKTEVEVMRLLSLGHKAKTIAQLVGVSKSTVDKMVSNSDDSRSLLSRVEEVGSREELIRWYTANTQPERITEVLVYQEPPWYRYSAAMPIALFGFFMAALALFLLFWMSPRGTLPDWFPVILPLLIPLVILFLGNIGWIYLRVFKKVKAYQGVPATNSLHMGFLSFLLSSMLFIALSENAPYWFIYASYLLQMISYVYFVIGILQLYDLYPSSGSIILSVPPQARMYPSVIPSWAVFISIIFLVYLQWSHFYSLENTVMILLQILRLLFAWYALNVAFCQLSNILRIHGLPLNKDDQDVQYIVVLKTIIVLIWLGFTLFYIADVGFVITTSLSKPSFFGYVRGGVIDILYAAALFVIGVGMLLVPSQPQAFTADFESDG